MIVAIAGLFSVAALALDLMNEGLAYQLLWELTGETEPLDQLLGGAQYAANFTRRTPDTGANIPVENIPQNPFGVNAFLELEAEASNRERSMQLVAEAGFGWLRQHFAWEDIEIDAKGEFWDRRNLDADINEDGVIDSEGFSSWYKYDHIMELADAYGVQILARISGPTPQWALPEGMDYTHTPPADTQDFVDYAVAVATRYQGRIHYYQIWNEPNLTAEWGNQIVDPERYTDLLCRTHDALKAIDPSIVVLTGAIGPTIELSGHNAYDMLYLQRMYDFGAADCFDILSAQGYGLFTGPTDRRMRPYTINFARHEWLRDIMLANGDGHKPIWISEAGWNPVPDDPSIVGYEMFGQVTPEEAAEWAVLAYERMRDEWPWVGMMSYWFLKRPSDYEKNQSYYYFRLVEPDWETTPTYEQLKSYIQSGDWQHTEKAWSTHSRELLPWVLTGGLAVVLAGLALGDALLKRLSRDEAEL